MTEPSWKPRFRAPQATVTKVLRSPSFSDSRACATEIIDDAVSLRELADVVEIIDNSDAPLSAIADRVAAAVGLLRARADLLDSGTAAPIVAGDAVRERLVVAALHYLVTPVDLVPDFKVGGYVDDVMLLGWVSGVAARELEPYLEGGDGWV